jgi:hypothetical protein
MSKIKKLIGISLEPAAVTLLTRILTDVKITNTHSIIEAKRILVAEVPEFIFLEAANVQELEQAKIFFHELSEHPSFRLIKRAIFSEKHEPPHYGNVDYSFSLPINEAEVRKALNPAQSLNLGSDTSVESLELSKKLEQVQLILAKVLHSLKTSDLLRLASPDDIPRIVAQMTKKICGLDTEATELASKRDGDQVDLSKIFKQNPPK